MKTLNFIPLIPPTPTSSVPTITPSVEQLTQLLPGWTYKDNGKCNVQFPIPPKDKNNYLNWDFPVGNAYPTLLSKITNESEYMDKEYDQANAWYLPPEDVRGSGDILKAVFVRCLTNKNNLDNEKLFKKIITGIEEYNKKTIHNEWKLKAIV